MAIISVRLDQIFRVRVVKSDTPTLSFQIFDVDNTFVDLTNVSSINFTVQRDDGVNIIDKTGSIVAGTTGLVDFAFASGDINQIGDFVCEISAVLTGGGIRTYGQGKLIVSKEIKA